MTFQQEHDNAWRDSRQPCFMHHLDSWKILDWKQGKNQFLLFN